MKSPVPESFDLSISLSTCLSIYPEALQCSSSLAMTYFLLRDHDMLPQKELPLSLWVERFCNVLCGCDEPATWRCHLLDETEMIGDVLAILFMIELLHDFIYQDARNYGSIVYIYIYMGSCRIYILNSMKTRNRTPRASKWPTKTPRCQSAWLVEGVQWSFFLQKVTSRCRSCAGRWLICCNSPKALGLRVYKYTYFGA